MELQTKDFSSLYNFKGKKTRREELMNVLAFVWGPVPKSTLAKKLNNIYTKSCLPELKRTGAVKEDSPTGELSLHSELFRSAVLLHIVPKLKKGDAWFEIAQEIMREMAEKGSYPQNGISGPE